MGRLEIRRRTRLTKRVRTPSLEHEKSILDREAEGAFRALRDHQQHVVFAESCTGGLLSSAIASFPGASNHLVGGFVIYSEWSKTNWLGVSETLLRRSGAVSEPCVRALLRGALRRTPKAGLAVATSGYLGPGGSLDGLIYLGVQFRGKAPIVVQCELMLSADRVKPLTKGSSLRETRRLLASTLVFFLVRSLLNREV